MGFDEITKYAIQPGVHQPGIQCALFFNKDAYDKLPEHYKYILDIAAKETQLWSYNWINASTPRPSAASRKKWKSSRWTRKPSSNSARPPRSTSTSLKAKYPDVKKVMDSQEAFLADFADWRDARSGVTPWPYETFVGGRTTE
jgi:TRAP-type mannitol/chloroaromatic compound transport system substrate-binding protein